MKNAFNKMLNKSNKWGKGTLCSIFCIASIGGLNSSASNYTGAEYRPPENCTSSARIGTRGILFTHTPYEKWGLSDGEKAFAESIFGDQINANIITKYFYDIENPCAAAFVRDTHGIHFMRPRYASNSYDQDPSAFNFGIFIHELTHIWQRQNNQRYTDIRAFRAPRIYHYQLDPENRPFTSYEREEQGAMLEDYVRVFLRSGSRARFAPYYSGANEDLRDVVEAQFPRARETREYYETHGVLPWMDNNRIAHDNTVQTLAANHTYRMAN